jgi:predicted dehydrogenase
MTQKAVKLALIGCGQISRLHAQRVVADGRATIVSLCDPSRAHAARLAAEFAPGARIVPRLDNLLIDGESRGGLPDVAIVCTPTHEHFDQVRALRSRGVHVLCEKPLADTRDRLVALAAEARGHGPLLSVAYQRRYWATFRTLAREVRSGRHGPLRSMTAINCERWQQTIAGTWRDDPAMNPGGFIGDAGSHKIDMVFFLTGLRPLEVFARSERRGSRVEIATSVLARLESDVTLTMSFLGDTQHYREDFSIHLAEADLLLRDERLWICRENRTLPLEDLEPESDPVRAFLDCVLHQAPNVAPADVALPVWDFTQAVLESARSGVAVGARLQL